MTIPLFLHFLFLVLALLACQSSSSVIKRDDGNIIRGVNLGGWFVLEQWITPSLFPTSLSNRGAVDQWTWMEAIANDTKALHLLKKHWSTFILEDDFAEMAESGLNTVRIPVPHWAFNNVAWEPYIGNGTEQPYIAQALLWAQQYHLNVILDLHTAPGSQNGYANSGRKGDVDFASSPNTTQNADRVISALKEIDRLYVSNESFSGIVTMIEVLNEPLCSYIGQAYLGSFYQRAYAALSNSTAQKIIFHDCFTGDPGNWDSFFSNATVFQPNSVVLDTHRYQAYSPQLNLSYNEHIQYTCQDEFSTKEEHPFTLLVGEFSLSVGCKNSRSPAIGTCDRSNMNDSLAMLSRSVDNLFYRRFFEAQTTTYEANAMGWLFWNWKTESNPTWSYQTALSQGWIPRDPTEKAFQVKDGCPTTTMEKTVTFAVVSDSASSSGTALNSLNACTMLLACILSFFFLSSSLLN